MAGLLHLAGAKTHLGLSVSWRYSFLPAGCLVERMTDAVFIDVGGRLEAGVIDHHHANAAKRSSARLVVEHPGFVHEHLVAPWIAADRLTRVRGRSWAPTIVMHTSPDFDAIVSTCLVQSLVEHGEFPAGHEALLDYADSVDMGGEKPSLPEKAHELYPLILMLQNTPSAHECGDTASVTLEELGRKVGVLQEDGNSQLSMEKNELVLRVGLHLVQSWLAGQGKNGGKQDKQLVGSPVAERLAESLHRDVDRFKNAQSRYQRLGPVAVASSPSHEPVSLEAAVLRACECEALQCTCDPVPIACDKIYMRLGLAAEAIASTPLTVIEKPWRSTAGGEASRHRWWIISIDPQADASVVEASLEGLGASLEWAEQDRREALGVTETSRRFGVARYAEYPGVADPWYDGRGHQYTIVDSPRNRSVLTCEEVVRILKEKFWDPLCESGTLWTWSGEAWGRDASPLRCEGRQRLGQFLDHARAASKDGYMLAVVRVRSGWSAERFAAAIRDFVSGDPSPTRLACGTAYVGPRGAVVALAPGATTFSPGPSLDSVFALHAELQAVERQTPDDAIAPGFRADSPRSAGGAKCRDLRKRYITAVAKYHTNREGESPDNRALRLALEEVLRIDRRREGTGDVLQLLDDEEQEMSEWRLNRLVLILTAIGVLQTWIAACDAFEKVWSGELPSTSLAFHAVWAVMMFGFTLTLTLFALSLASTRVQRVWACMPLLRSFFPEYRRPTTGIRASNGRERPRHP